MQDAQPNDIKTARQAGRFLYSIAIFLVPTTSIPIAATILTWLNDDDLTPTASKIPIPTPITVTTVAIVNTDTSATIAEINALSGRRTGAQQGSGCNHN
jgi:hypothetical protein